jgi:GNAT superfamily N-acetyltransferase
MIHIRMANRTDAAAIAHVHAATWKEAYRGLLDSTFLDNLSDRRLAARWRTQLDRREQDFDEETLVALNGRELVGFASASASREAFAPWDAEISMIYVLKESRGAGIGRGLMKATADHCIRRGMFSGGLWVLRDNGAARDFYEALGGEPTGRKADSVGGQIVQLVGYWWRDLALLAERSTPANLPGRY